MPATTEESRKAKSVANKLWRKSNPEQAASSNKEWVKKNPERSRAIKRKWEKANPEKVAAKGLRWAEANPEKMRLKRRKHQLKKKFGLSVDQYNQMFVAQEGRCAICERHQTEFKKAFAVGHDHRTNAFRGLLCPRCNLGLGQFYDSLELLGAAFKYIADRSA